ncbi:MAG: PilZ domain-containing protein [Planctomycetes bacterium]|nr:PilZ domain-containing protein [Planctomycetota bacterium]
MANILIADLRGKSAYFLKAFYKGSGHKVIIASDVNRAKMLIETGVFDVLVVDLTVADVEILSVVNHAQCLILVMPIIAVTSKESIDKAVKSKIFSQIARPISTEQIRKTLADALDFISMTCVNKRREKRAEVSIPVLMRIDNMPIPAHGRDLSENGILIEVQANSRVLMGQTIPALIQLPDESLEVTGTVSFIKSENDNKIIGLKFVSKKTVRFKRIGGFLNKAS